MSHRLRAHTPRGTPSLPLPRSFIGAAFFFPGPFSLALAVRPCPFFVPLYVSHLPGLFSRPFLLPCLGLYIFLRALLLRSYTYSFVSSFLFLSFRFCSLFLFNFLFFSVCFLCFFLLLLCYLFLSPPFSFPPVFFWAFFSGPLLLFPASPLSSDALKKLSYML